MAQLDGVRQSGSLAASIRVGTDSAARPFIESDLGPTVPLTAGAGHDGFHYYLAATDPFALDEERQSAYVAYRHRRILGPLLAGGAGLLDPRAALFGLSVVGLAGFILAAAAAAMVSESLGTRPWGPLGVVSNVGLILSLQLVTGDALATGLALAAVAAALRARAWPSVLLMTGAVMTKETSLLFAVGLAWWLWSQSRRRVAMAMVAIPATTLAVWMGYLEWQLGDAFSTNGNLGAPGFGMIQAAANWLPGADQALGWLALGSVALCAGALYLSRHALLVRLGVPWVAMALVSSVIVWGDGNNAARVFAPCWAIGFLALGHHLSRVDG